MASNAQPTYNRRKAKRLAVASLGALEKRPKAGHNVSHAHNKTKRLFKPNLQKTKVLLDGKLVSVRLDAKTIRTLTKAEKPRPERAKKAAPKTTSKPATKPAAKKTTAKK